MKTPWEYAETGNEHSHQVALFAWCGMARNVGIEIANRPEAYTISHWAKGIYEDYKRIDKYWEQKQYHAIPQLKWLHAISNHGAGYGRKAEGVREGVADIFLPVPKAEAMPVEPGWNGDYDGWSFCSGLYIELKRPDSKGKAAGKPSKPQEDFAAYCLETGYAHEFCWGWLEARDIILKYLGLV